MFSGMVMNKHWCICMVPGKNTIVFCFLGLGVVIVKFFCLRVLGGGILALTIPPKHIVSTVSKKGFLGTYWLFGNRDETMLLTVKK